MKKTEATYRKTLDTSSVMIAHTIRIPLNSDRKSIEKALGHVPYFAKVSMIVDDTKLEGCGEIIFENQYAMENEAFYPRFTEAIKLPPGLKPRRIHNEHRAAEIAGSMQRYMDAEKPIPREWIAELVDVLKIIY